MHLSKMRKLLPRFPVRYARRSNAPLHQRVYFAHAWSREPALFPRSLYAHMLILYIQYAPFCAVSVK